MINKDNEKGLLEILEERQGDIEARKKREEFFEFIRGKPKIERLAKIRKR